MKRLICCLDGTWNDDKREDALTNVVKLRRAIPAHDAAGVRQIAHYVEGIATGYTGKLRFAIGAVALEVGDRIRAGYKFLVENYEPGDEIYLFGFSRGAFQARSLAGLIAHVGIVRRDGAVDMAEVWRAYTHRRARSGAALLAKLRANAHHPVRIKCVGVWDTVGNLGNPLYPHGLIGLRFKFHDTSLSDTVDVALHALSIDEKRGPFSPTLWTLPRGKRLPAHQHVEQVWMAGVHADIGGGYKETALSDIGLMWMAERVAATTPLAIDLEHLRRTTQPDPLGLQHSSTISGIFKWSALLPYVRLVGQEMRAVRLARRLGKKLSTDKP